MRRKSAAGLAIQNLLDFDLTESSSDEDFVPREEESEDDFNSDEDENGAGSGRDDDDDGGDDSDESSSSGSDLGAAAAAAAAATVGKGTDAGVVSMQQLLSKGADKAAVAKRLAETRICSTCLGEKSDDSNEIVECDGCGMTVHEGCYGISDSTSISSTVSSCSTEPWFCEACKAGVSDPDCELCPNKGGIFKETECGRWVHLVCALYVPGVAFGEVDQLSSVTLFEMPYNRWGARPCSLCEDAHFARTGVCIGCDAGLCKTYFHVTCAQAAGFLAEAHTEEVEQADPFYAHCKVHSDKTLVKRRKRNFCMLRLQFEQRKAEKEQKKAETPSEAQQRIERKLKKHRSKYLHNKATKAEAWVPTQKMPRSLTTSAAACKRLARKAELMGINTRALEFEEMQMAALADVRKKWHIPPGFSVEFVGYYLDRSARVQDLKRNLQEQIVLNERLLEEQQTLRVRYDDVMKTNDDFRQRNVALKREIEKYHSAIQTLSPNKQLIPVDSIGNPNVPPPSHAPAVRTITVPTAAALKMGVGFPLNNLVPGGGSTKGRILSTQCPTNNEDLLNECGICKRRNDQHLLAKCDTCHLYYHLGCLSPPLTRHPKKSKLYGWQCSECDNSEDSEVEKLKPKAPRRSRTRYSKDGRIVPGDYEEPSSAGEKTPKKLKSPRKSDATKATVTINGPLTPSKLLEKAVVQLTPMSPIEILSSPSTNKTTTPDKPKRKRKKKTITPGPVAKQARQAGDDEEEVIIIDDAPPPADDPLAVSTPIPTPSTTANAPNTATTVTPPEYKQKTIKMTVHVDNRNYVSKIVSDDPLATTTPAATPEEEAQRQKKLLKKLKRDKNAAAALVAPLNSQFSSESINGLSDSSTPHKARKKRKEKHRDRTSEDGSESTGHKRKRKRKNHEAPVSASTTAESEVIQSESGHPRIKIKIKTIPRPDGQPSDGPTQMFCVRSDSNEQAITPPVTLMLSKSLDSSVNFKKTIIPHVVNNSLSDSVLPMTTATSAVEAVATPTTTPMTTPAVEIPVTKPKRGRRSSQPDKVNNTSQLEGVGCDVCHQAGTAQNLVKCDECLKNYHFTCLDPPLKKNPKKRGYTWHCADCDPTDNELK